MLEVKNNNLIIDDKTRAIDEINMIQSAKGKLYFSNSIVEISENSHDINEVYKKLQSAGFNNFILLNNVIVNVDNIDSLQRKYFQYAGISIIQCDKENYEMCMLVLNCKNNSSENISYGSCEDMEKDYNAIHNAMIDLKNDQLASL